MTSCANLLWRFGHHRCWGSIKCHLATQVSLNLKRQVWYCGLVVKSTLEATLKAWGHLCCSMEPGTQHILKIWSDAFVWAGISACSGSPLFCSLMLITFLKTLEMLRHAQRVKHLNSLAAHPPVCLAVCPPPRETGIRGLGGPTVWKAYE